MPRLGSYSGPIAKMSARRSTPGSAARAPSCRSRARRRRRASPARRSGTCTCSRRRGRTPRRRRAPGTEPAEWQRSHRMSAPASCAMRVISRRVGEIRRSGRRRGSARRRAPSRGRPPSATCSATRRGRVDVDPPHASGRARRRCPRARSGRWGSCRCRERSRAARVGVPARRRRPGELVEQHGRGVADDRLAGRRADHRAADASPIATGSSSHVSSHPRISRPPHPSRMNSPMRSRSPRAGVRGIAVEVDEAVSVPTNRLRYARGRRPVQRGARPRELRRRRVTQGHRARLLGGNDASPRRASRERRRASAGGGPGHEGRDAFGTSMRTARGR